MKTQDAKMYEVLPRIQGNISPGFRKDFQEFLFLRFPDAQSGKDWVKDLYPDITSGWEVATYNRLYRAIRHPPVFEAEGNTWPELKRTERRDTARFLRSTWLNVAFTGAGLAQLGLDLHALRLSPELRGGLLFKTTISGSEFIFGPKDEWQIRDSSRANVSGLADDSKITHAMLIVGADTATDLAIELVRQYRLLASHRVDLVTNLSGQTLGDGRVHFGFRDGLSQPDPDDPLDKWELEDIEFSNEQIVLPGEFILGCENESDTDPSEHEWARFGSYLVFLKLEQDVRLFQRTMREQAEKLSNAGMADMTSALLTAKAVGRWPSGAPVKEGARTDPFGEKDPEDKRKDLRVLTSYFTDDPKGDGCPLFSHVRKANPRGNVVVNGKDVTRKHRLIRRGIPYGPPYVDGADDAKGDRGLLFLAYQADIEHQFEFIMKQWISEKDFPKPAAPAGLDPFMGIDSADHESEDAAFNAFYHREGQGEGPLDYESASFERCIKAKGGGYFFAPSIPALAVLATNQVQD